jgi:hypothetical protein
MPALKRLRGSPAPSDTPVPRRRSGYTTKAFKKPAHAYVSDPAVVKDDEERLFKRLDDVHVLVPAKDRGQYWTNITSEARPPPEGIPLGGIRVQRDVTLR